MKQARWKRGRMHLHSTWMQASTAFPPGLAGFGSLRRFNAVFLDAYRMAPRDLRKRPVTQVGDTLVLRLGYRPPYDFASMLAFLRGRALPGVEVVDEASYSRVIGRHAWKPRARWKRLDGCAYPPGPTASTH